MSVNSFFRRPFVNFRRITLVLSVFVLALMTFALRGDRALTETNQPGTATTALVPSISATMTDTLVNDDGDSKIDPTTGVPATTEKILYSATITNSGADPATGVIFTDTIDLHTTLVNGSVKVTPIAVNESFDTIGNTQLQVGGTALPQPGISIAGDVRSNDIDPKGGTLTLTPITNGATTRGGLVTLLADGSFTYTPPVGVFNTNPATPANLPDTFTYTITNGDNLTATGTVTINIVNARIWYVKNDQAAGGLGRSGDPFDTLLEADTASAAGDTIYVFNGSGNTTGQSAGITLDANQRFYGEGVALTVPGVTVNGTANPTLRALGTQPMIDNTNAGGNGVTVGNNAGVDIQGLNIGGNTNAIDATFTGATGALTIVNNTIRSAGQEGIDINISGGTINVALSSNAVTSTGNGIDINRTAGTAAITAFSGNTVTGNTGGIGVNIVGTGATIVFDANTATTAFDTVSGGNTAVGASGNGVGASGMVLNNVRGDLSFSDLDIFADSGNALLINSTTPNFNAGTGTGMRVVANTGTPVLSATGGSAANVTDANINLVLNSLTSSITTAAQGVSLTRVSGTFTAPSGSSITSTNAGGTGFFIDGGSNANANVAVTYGGTITADIGRLVQIQNVTASSTHAFTGAITDNNDGDGGETGVSLTGNTGATMTFSGGLAVRTTTNAAFTATGGGTVNVCDENPCNPGATGGSVNTLTTTTGTALNVANTTIGANNLEFRSISANGAANGIALNATGSSGGLKVKGNGGTCTSAATCTGGTIQNTTGSGVELTNTNSVALTNLNIDTTGSGAVAPGTGVAPEGHGIEMNNGSGLTLTGVRVVNAGNADNEHGLAIVNATGTISLDGTTFNGAANDLVYVTHTGALTFNVSNSSSFSYPVSVSPTAGNAILLEPSGSGSITASIQNSTFTNIRGGSALIGSNTLNANGTHSFNFSNNTITVNLPMRGSGVTVSGQELTTTNITINNNNFSGAGGNGVISTDTNDTSIVKGTVNGNTITNPPGIGMFHAVDEAGKSDVIINGNTITNSGGDGIQVVNFASPSQPSLVSTMDMTITNNQVNGHSSNTAVNFVGGISFTHFSESSPNPIDSSCLVLRGNTVTGTPAGATQCGGAPCVDYYI